MSELESRFVKTELWTNIDKGPVIGRTITTDTRSGAIVVALLAVLSSVGTAHLWQLVTFCIHQHRADGRLRDGLHRQQQASLRTLPTSASIMMDSIKLWWTWRHKSDRAMARSLILTLLACVFTTIGLVVGIFSSYVVTSSNLEVLVSSPSCTSNLDNFDGGIFGDATETYRRACYGRAAPLPALCNVFIRPNIPFTSSRGPCPFDPSFCKPNTSAIELDSGLLDIAQMFGLNVGEGDALGFRRRTSCAVMDLQNRTTLKTASSLPAGYFGPNIAPEDAVLSLNYGPTSLPAGTPLLNSTFYVPLAESNATFNIRLDYRIHYARQDYYSHRFEPVKEVARNDGDVVLKIIQPNGLQFKNEVNDPLLSAHKALIALVMSGKNATFYGADSPINVVGCVAQYQFCLPRTPQGQICTDLGGLVRDASDLNLPGLSDIQRTILNQTVISSSLIGIGIDNTMNITSLVEGTVIYDTLPDDQWISEVKLWESFVWAGLQITLADFAIGRLRRPTTSDATTPKTPAQKQLCTMQKMRKSGGFVNINVFGLAFTISVCAAIITINTCLLRFLIYLSKFRRALAPKIDRWIQDGVLQLQRRAYEAQGEGSWVDLENEIPTTQHREKFSDLPIHTDPSCD